MVLAAGTLPAAPVLALMALGVLVAIGGHLYGSRGIVAAGLAILFIATAAMVVGGFVAYKPRSGRLTGKADIRKERDPREPTL